MTEYSIYGVSFASVYPHYVAKAEKKGHTRAEVDEVIRWPTGFSQDELDTHIAGKTTFEGFFAAAPPLHPCRALIKVVIWRQPHGAATRIIPLRLAIRPPGEGEPAFAKTLLSVNLIDETPPTHI